MYIGILEIARDIVKSFAYIKDTKYVLHRHDIYIEIARDIDKDLTYLTDIKYVHRYKFIEIARDIDKGLRVYSN